MNIQWMQWSGSRTKDVVAFAVDPTNPTRSINGSLIPASATPAEPTTPKDAFCERILDGWSRKMPRNKRHREWLKGAELGNLTAPIVDMTPRLARVGKQYNVMVGTEVLASIDASRIKSVKTAHAKVTDKSWGVYEDGKRVAFGKRK